MFTSTGSQVCGQEVTLLSSIPVFSHHGMVFVPLGLTHPDQSNLTEVKGGSAYGSGTVAFVPESPTELELRIAEYQGETFAEFVRDHYFGKYNAPKKWTPNIKPFFWINLYILMLYNLLSIDLCAFLKLFI